MAHAVVGLAQDTSLRCALGVGARREAEASFWTWEARLQAELEEVARLVGEGVDAEAAAAGHGRG